MKLTTVAALATILSSTLMANAQQVAPGRYHPDSCPAGISDSMVTVSPGRLEFWESTCQLTNPVPVRGMAGAILFDGQCGGEGQTWTRRYMIMPSFEGGMVLVGEQWSRTYVRCGP